MALIKETRRPEALFEATLPNEQAEEVGLSASGDVAGTCWFVLRAYGSDGAEASFLQNGQAGFPG